MNKSETKFIATTTDKPKLDGDLNKPNKGFNWVLTEISLPKGTLDLANDYPKIPESKEPYKPTAEDIKQIVYNATHQADRKWLVKIIKGLDNK